jgi:hypothetical protein
MFVGSDVSPVVFVQSLQLKVAADNVWFHNNGLFGAPCGVWHAIQTWAPGVLLLMSCPPVTASTFEAPITASTATLKKIPIACPTDRCITTITSSFIPIA